MQSSRIPSKHACLWPCHIRKTEVWSQRASFLIPFFLLHLWIPFLLASPSKKNNNNQKNHNDLGKVEEMSLEPICTCLSAALKKYINIHLWRKGFHRVFFPTGAFGMLTLDTATANKPCLGFLSHYFPFRVNMLVLLAGRRVKRQQ